METKPGDGLTVSGVPGVLDQQRASLQQNIPSKEKLHGGSSACLNQGLDLVQISWFIRYN